MSFRDEIQREAVETALKHTNGSIGLPMRTGKIITNLT
jgi:hypothetical protein